MPAFFFRTLATSTNTAKETEGEGKCLHKGSDEGDRCDQSIQRGAAEKEMVVESGATYHRIIPAHEFTRCSHSKFLIVGPARHTNRCA
jgi:hypothetical protein